jgi:hypothetical protein
MLDRPNVENTFIRGSRQMRSSFMSNHIVSCLLLCSRPASSFINYSPLVSIPSRLLHKFNYNKAIRGSITSDFFIDHQQQPEFDVVFDTRPFEQRVDKPRPARRMNQSFQHLYRHKDETFVHHSDEDEEDDTSLLDVESFLIKYGGFTANEVSTMNRMYPALNMLDVEGKVKPMLKFIKYTLEGVHTDSVKRFADTLNKAPTTTFFHCYIDRINEVWQKQQEMSGATHNAIIPLSSVAKSAILQVPQIFGARLERTVAPRHAFLVFKGLAPYFGESILKNNGELLKEFLNARSSKQFAELCNRWAAAAGVANEPVTDKQVEAFETYFRRGLMAAARNSVNDEDGADYLKTLKTL